MRLIKAMASVVLLAAAVIFFTANTLPMKQDYDEKWNRVDSLSDLRQPRSAIEVVDEIYKLAKSDHNTAQVIKANLYRIKLMSEFEEDFLVKSINRLNEDLRQAETPENQLLHSIIGELYTRYYQMNRHKILDRGKIAGSPGDDIRTWDAAAFAGAARDHFLKSLDRKEKLQEIDIDAFQAILEKEKESENYRPTLYDFLAFRAIAYFSNTEMELPVAAAQYIPDTPEFFSPAAEFVHVSLDPRHQDANTALAIQTYQTLLAFHLNDDDPQALIDADLQRLEFLYNRAVVANKDSLYLSALQLLEGRFKSSPHHTRVSYRIAAFYDQQANQYNPSESEDHRWDRKKAMEICEQAIEAFPESRGAQNCKVLLSQITKPDLDFTSEYAVIPGEPSLGLLRWKNLGQVYFRLISYDAAAFGELNMRNNREELAEQLTKAEPFRQWDIPLDVEQDYQPHSAEFKIPALDAGFYVLLASNREDFSGEFRLLAWNGFWSTSLSYITRRIEEGGQELFVLNRKTGRQIGEVSVRLIKRDYDYRTRQYQTTEAGSFVTDENGYLRIEASEDLRGAVNFELQKGEDSFQTQKSYYLRPPGKRVEKPREKSYFFTDRSVYRPGQTVYFKTILLEQTGQNLVILPGKSTTVEFRDVNNQLISSLDLNSNEYGSVHGSFSIPQGILNGQMSLKNGSGSVSVQVEEYKRPSFEVTFEAVEGSYRVGEQVELEGQALAYAGNAIDGAEVSYRVVRRSRFPFFGYGYSRWFPQSPEVEIATGETTTDDEGRFTVTFKAIPDDELRPELKPVFSYYVEASVTDISGETQRGSETVSVGYQALFLKTDLPEQVNLDEVNRFKVTAENLSGIKQDATVTVEVFRLEAPDRLITDRLWQQPDVYLTERKAFLEDFPHRIYKNEDDPRDWKKAEQVMQQTINTAVDSVISPENFAQWDQGKYLVTLTATDAFGEKVESESYVTLFDPESRKPPLPLYDWFVPLKSKAEPGEEATFLLGTSARNVSVLYEIQHNGELVSREWLRMGREQKVISVPVKEEYRGNFGITASFVIDNRIYQNS
ncbi:MAG: MG2 domain-containing protein, partial [Bacteroidales bacterium]